MDNTFVSQCIHVERPGIEVGMDEGTKVLEG